MANRLPADLTDETTLPEFFVHANCGYTTEWFEMDHGQRSVVLYRYTASGRFTWSECLTVSASETHASITRRAADLHRQAA